MMGSVLAEHILLLCFCNLKLRNRDLNVLHLIIQNTCSDSSHVSDPVHVPGHTCVDAVLPLFSALITPADNARQEPRVCAQSGGVRSTTVSLARVLAGGQEPSTEHKAWNLIATFALGAVHIGNLDLLQRVGLQPSVANPAPPTHQRERSALQQVLREGFWTQADRDNVVGERGWRFEFQQGDVMVVALLILVVRMDMVLVDFMIALPLFINLNVMFSWWEMREREKVEFLDLR